MNTMFAPETIEEMVECINIKLRVCDLRNKQSEGAERFRMGEDEIRGMKHMLYVIGYELVVNYNPYFWQNGEPSTVVINRFK